MPRFLALYMGTQDSEVQKAWDNLPDAERAERSRRAMSEWGHWVERHQHVIVDIGAPLGKTLLASPEGITPTHNAITAYVIIEAASHARRPRCSATTRISTSFRAPASKSSNACPCRHCRNSVKRALGLAPCRAFLYRPAP
jgi:hypothetical protein